MAEELMLKVEDVYKKYRLGTIGGGTLTADLQSWWARVRHKEDPNSKIGAKTYGKNEVFYALNGISFEVKKGEALGIIGGNGAGKSTTLKLISQVTAPTKGKIYLNGRITSMLEVGTGFHPELTGRENIYLNGAILGMTKAEIDRKIEEIIDFSECRQFIDTPVKRYSSGMYVKLAFSVAAHLDSEIMIMDEVLAVGDMKFQQKCLKKMRSIANDEGRTILYVSHNMSTIRQLCDRCIVLSQGKKIFDGNVESAIKHYMRDSMIQQKFNDFTHTKRDSGVTKEMKMISLELLNSSNLIKYGSKLKFVLAYSTKIDIESLVFRFNFHRSDGGVFATALTSCISAKKDNQYKKVFEIDTSSFAPASYRIRITAFEPDFEGGQIRYDCIESALSFEIYNDNPEFNMDWDTSWWGNYIMPDVVEIDK